MNSQHVMREALRRAGVSRRDILRWLPASGLVLAAQPFGRRARAQQAPLVFEWSGYELPQFHQAYLDKHGGVSPDFGFFASQDEAFNKVRAGYAPDLVHPCASQSWKWIDAGFIQPIDTTRLGNWGQVWPTLQAMDGVKGPAGDIVMIPFDWGNTSFCYNTELANIDPANESWASMLDPQYAGKLSADETEDNFRGVAFGIGIKDVINLTPEDMENVKQALLEQKKLVRFYWETATDLAQAFSAGEIVISTCWNETSAKLIKEGVPVKMANPKEGMITWVCGLVHTTRSEADGQAVYDFIDAFLSKESGAYLINEYGYGHANQEAFKMVPAERLAELGISNPDEMMGRTFLSGPGQDFDSMMRIITEVQAGA